MRVRRTPREVMSLNFYMKIQAMVARVEFHRAGVAIGVPVPIEDVDPDAEEALVQKAVQPWLQRHPGLREAKVRYDNAFEAIFGPPGTIHYAHEAEDGGLHVHIDPRPDPTDALAEAERHLGANE